MLGAGTKAGRSASCGCRNTSVLSSRLETFGSATRDRFDPARSDLDFLVSFRTGSTGLDHYLRLAERLERLLGRSVDLVIERAIRNPYFRKTVDGTRTLVYAHGEQEAPV